MLSPLKPSVPSASLLRFLRSQSEVSIGSAACAQPRPRLSCQVQFATGSSRRSSSWARPSQSQYALISTGDSIFTTSSRPKATGPRSILEPLIISRNTSTTRRPFLRRLFDLKRNKDAECKNARPGPALIDDTAEGMFNIGRGLAARASNELRIRCTEFDNNGNVTLVNGEFRKLELIAKYGLLPRDLRKIDSSTLPHILIRPSAILINLLHLRVLIKSDRVLVFDAYGSTDSYMQSLFIYDLEAKLRQKSSQVAQGAQSLPYELRALEAVLISVTTGLEEEFNGVRDPVVRVLRALEEDIDRDKLRHLLVYSKKLGTFEQKARLVRDAIDDLLEADDDLAAMYLTERSCGKEREEDDHQEVEMLLESYHKVCDEIVQASGSLVTGIRNTEEIVKAILDANRNSLMLLDLKFSIGTLGLAAGTLFSALYGMNLKNFIEEDDFGFGGVSAVCFILTGIVCYYGLGRLRKLQRVRMWGENGVGTASLAPPLSPRRTSIPSTRSNWRAESIEPVWGSLPGEVRSDRMKRLHQTAAASAANIASRTSGTNIPNSSAAAATAAFESALNSEASKSTGEDQSDGPKEKHDGPGTTKSS